MTAAAAHNDEKTTWIQQVQIQTAAGAHNDTIQVKQPHIIEHGSSPSIQSQRSPTYSEIQVQTLLDQHRVTVNPSSDY